MIVRCHNGHDVTGFLRSHVDKKGRTRAVSVQCPTCGTSQVKRAACPRCGTEAPKHADWCDSRRVA